VEEDICSTLLIYASRVSKGNSMNDFNDNTAQEAVSVESIKRRIADIASKPLEEHSNEFEAVHADLQRALSGIDGL